MDQQPGKDIAVSDADSAVADLIKNPELLKQIMDTPAVQSVMFENFRGPVPSPSMLEKYGKLLPGLANRLVELTEKEQHHRHSVSAHNMTLTARGQILAFVLVILVICSAIYFGVQGNTLLAGILAGLDFAALAVTFITGHYFSVKSASKEHRD